MRGAAHANVLFVTVADNRIGLGHLNRCLSVAAVAAESGAAPRFVVFGEGRAAEQVSDAGYPVQILPVADLARGFRGEPVDAAVVDVVYPAFFCDGNVPAHLFRPLRQTAKVVAAIDSLGQETLAEREGDIPADFLVVPYALADADRARLVKVGCDVLSGPDFALLSSEYIGLPEPASRIKADRVLVTCGGSDPLAWTFAVICALDDIADPLTVRVIVGPLFAPALRVEVAECAAASVHRVELVDAPDSLAAHMQWCDVAIAASGLTKYELAATGTPTVLFSIDEFHDQNNRAFAALQIAEDLGASPSRTTITAAARALLGDRNYREAMSAAARRVVDGRGAQRLIAKIMEKLSCSKKN